MKFDLTLTHDRTKFIQNTLRLLRKSAKVDQIEKFPGRTVKQNAYFHVLVTYIAVETGESIERTKRMLKRQRLDVFGFVEDGFTHLRSSADLSTKEMSDMCEWIRDWASIELGSYLPTPDEYKQNWFEIERELERKKAH